MKFTAAVALSIILLCGACGAEPVPVIIPTLMQLPTGAPPPTDEPVTPTETPEPPIIEATATDEPATPTEMPTDTATDLPLASETPTVTPSLTITPTPTYTPSATLTPTVTPTPSPEPRALNGLLELALHATVLPATFVAPPPMQQQPPLLQPPPQAVVPGAMPPPVRAACPVPPGGSFGTLYGSDSAAANLLGCPVGGDYTLITAVQMFERGAMLYISGQPGAIYALFSDGRFQRFDDTFIEGIDPERGAEGPPVGLVAPVRGFLKVWQSSPTVRAALGWGVTEEAGNESRLLNFEHGRMIYLPQRNQTVVLIEDPGGASGTWRMLPGGA